MRVLQAATIAFLLLAAPAGAAGLELKDTKTTGRLTELTFATDALTAETKVRVLTPQGYEAGAKRYPVLYLLHGSFGDFDDWTTQGDAEAATAGLPLIVVMPDGGAVGNYTDWFNDGAFGPPEWERYHIHQLLPWIDAHFRTTGTRRGRAIAGLSMGGGGTLKYAGAYPDKFTAAYGFSPGADLEATCETQVTQAGGISDGSHTPGAIYGYHETDDVRWRNENSVDLAINYRPVQLSLLTGDGNAGGPDGNDFDPVEYCVHDQTLNLHRALLRLGIPHVLDDYGPGGHSWYYWTRDLKQILPGLMARFAHAPQRPAHVTYTRADPDYTVFGWKVHVERPALEFSTLRGAGRRGFTLEGSGTGTVRTPRFFAPGAKVRATLTSGAPEATTVTLRADRRGRVRVAVPLGPGNTGQQYAPNTTTEVFATHVRLRR
jgi:S-formylglutathione hydrolase FrmB